MNATNLNFIFFTFVTGPTYRYTGVHIPVTTGVGIIVAVSAIVIALVVLSMVLLIRQRRMRKSFPDVANRQHVSNSGIC